MASRSERFVFLDGLRGVAALVALLGHLSLFFPISAHYPYILAVDFFFVLSGFVIARTYLPRIIDGLSLWAFTRARLIRLYPMLLFGSLLGAAALAAHVFIHNDTDWWSVGLAVVLGVLVLPTFLTGMGESAFPINQPVWSLFFEIWANLLFVIVVMSFRRWSRWVFAAIAVVAFGAALANAALNGDTGGYMMSNFAGGVPRVLFAFFTGALLCQAPTAMRSGTGVGLILLLTLLVTLFAPIGLNAVYSVFIVALVFPLLIHLSSGVEVKGRLARACSFLGELSYPLYLLHFPILTLMVFITSRLDPEGSFLGFSIAASVVVCVGFSYAALKLIDEPTRGWLSQRFSQHKSGAGPLPVSPTPS
jgi:peptidoglycan/LPS O-acetylase OafA/YrhL